MTRERERESYEQMPACLKVNLLSKGEKLKKKWEKQEGNEIINKQTQKTQW